MALTNVLLLLGLGVAVSSASLQKRIIGGENCKDDERQYHVMVRKHSKTDWKFCGGSLISDQWVLTAAHCWPKDPSWVVDAHVGVHPKSVRKTIYRITHHVIYADSNGRKHDIMLLKLPSKTAIQPIKLPDCPDTLLLGTKVQIAGNGPARLGSFNKRIQHRPKDLQCGEMKIDKHERLEKILAEGKYFWYKHQKWYSVRSFKKDISFGDSGGGFVFKNRLYGVSTFLGDPVFSLSKPSGFMDVCAYKEWIDDTIN
ncbi:kallikrein-2-like [Poeciliopsis prolifica]|uniref:kallikrein-2-like n=1 Tax=Poeciliopsis prolifica TaxID=188132 RepID=UPI0024130824|nr:kallikrein-2-like [Poeciliopsis prolifica]XP_054900651.1 kallikrein-2-like [Poeciliopsis prolifica]